MGSNLPFKIHDSSTVNWRLSYSPAISTHLDPVSANVQFDTGMYFKLVWSQFIINSSEISSMTTVEQMSDKNCFLSFSKLEEAPWLQLFLSFSLYSFVTAVVVPSFWWSLCNHHFLKAGWYHGWYQHLWLFHDGMWIHNGSLLTCNFYKRFHFSLHFFS